MHERFSAAELQLYREDNPEVYVLAHPECPPDVLAEADFVGSTAGMVRHLEKQQPAQVVMLTECSMSDNVAVALPNVDFIRPCNLCPHMKRITLKKILRALEHMEYPVEVEAEVADRARLSVQRMLELGRGEGR